MLIRCQKGTAGVPIPANISETATAVTAMVGVAGKHYSNPHWDRGSDSGSGSGRGRGQKWIACNKQTLIVVAVVVATANKQTNKQTNSDRGRAGACHHGGLAVSLILAV